MHNDPISERVGGNHQNLARPSLTQSTNVDGRKEAARSRMRDGLEWSGSGSPGSSLRYQRTLNRSAVAASSWRSERMPLKNNAQRAPEVKPEEDHRID
jgi:hypothetical protein